MPMNPHYLKARKKALLTDEKKASCFSDWNRLALVGISFSAVALIGWLPGCILSAILDLLALRQCGIRKECGHRVALCGLFFALIGGAVSMATGSWRNVGSKLNTAAFAYLTLAIIVTMLVMLGLYGFYYLKKGGRHR